MEAHRVAVLVRHGVLAMELGIVHRVFGEAADAEGRPLYEVLTCALEPGVIRTDGDFTLAVSDVPDPSDRSGNPPTVAVGSAHLPATL